MFVHLDGKIEALGRVAPSEKAKLRVSFRGTIARRDGLEDTTASADEVSSEVVSLAIIDVRENFELQTDEAMAELRKQKGAIVERLGSDDQQASTGPISLSRRSTRKLHSAGATRRKNRKNQRRKTHGAHAKSSLPQLRSTPPASR